MSSAAISWLVLRRLTSSATSRSRFESLHARGRARRGTAEPGAIAELAQLAPDLVAVVDPQRVGGIGLSLSGEMLLEVAAEMKRLKAVVSEGAGQRSFREAGT